MRYVGAGVAGFLALVFSFATALLLAAGFNFGYELHPVFLVAAAPVGAVAVALTLGALALVRVRSLAVRLSVLAGAIPVCFALVVLDVEYGGPSRGEVERRNAPLLAEITPYPGARRGAVDSEPNSPDTDMFAEGYLNQGEGWTAFRSDALPAGTLSRRAADFYRRRMVERGWRVRTFYGGPSQQAEVIGRRGEALLDVVVTPRPLEATLVADFEGNRLCESPAQPGCW